MSFINLKAQSKIDCGEKISLNEFSSHEIHGHNFVYTGAGTFQSLRSCYIIWIGVDFDSVYFCKDDSTLTLKGTFKDKAKYKSPLLSGVEIIVGEKFKIDSTNGSRNTNFKIKKEYKCTASPYFDEKIKIGPNDYIYFVMAEEEKLDYQELRKKEDIKRILCLGWVKIIDPGFLFK
jgi:hypothetical protein